MIAIAPPCGCVPFNSPRDVGVIVRDAPYHRSAPLCLAVQENATQEAYSSNLHYESQLQLREFLCARYLLRAHTTLLSHMSNLKVVPQRFDHVDNVIAAQDAKMVVVKEAQAAHERTSLTCVLPIGWPLGSREE
jgi:hypothetical protein